MATLLTNSSVEGPLTLPSIYGGTLVAVGRSVIIADTPANVAAALGKPPASACSLELTADGQPGAIQPQAQSAVVDVLPAAGPSFRGARVTLRGAPAVPGPGTMDIDYVCLKKADDTFGWFAVGVTP